MMYEVYNLNTFILRNFLDTISLRKIWVFNLNKKNKNKTKQNKKRTNAFAKVNLGRQVI